MRVLLVLLLALPVSAEVIAGRTQILVHDGWTSLDGGPVTSLGVPAESAAFDGERFLVAWRDAQAVRLGLFEEGATTPLAVVVLNSASGTPIVRWDGTRYVVIVASTAQTEIAIVSRQGVLEHRTAIPDASAIVDAAASPFGIALASHYTTETHGSVIDVLLLDTAYRVAARSNIVRTTPLTRVTIASFGAAFLVAWQRSWSGRYQELWGARVALDGSTSVATRIEGPIYGQPLATGIGLHPYGSSLVVTSVREGGFESRASIVDANGAVIRTGYAARPHDAPVAIRSVRMPDGSIALVYANDGLATVRRLLNPPGVPARRRSARH